MAQALSACDCSDRRLHKTGGGKLLGEKGIEHIGAALLSESGLDATTDLACVCFVKHLKQMAHNHLDE